MRAGTARDAAGSRRRRARHRGPGARERAWAVGEGRSPAARSAAPRRPRGRGPRFRKRRGCACGPPPSVAGPGVQADG